MVRRAAKVVEATAFPSSGKKDDLEVGSVYRLVMADHFRATLREMGEACIVRAVGIYLGSYEANGVKWDAFGSWIAEDDDEDVAAKNAEVAYIVEAAVLSREKMKLADGQERAK